MAKGTKKKKEPRVIPGTSDYVVRENAARKQLGVAGLAARNKQVPTAARAALREMTGIDISRKGVSVDPMGVAMALPIGKVLKAAKALRTAGQAGNRLKFLAAEALEGRLAAKSYGKAAGKEIARNSRTPKMNPQQAQDSYERVADLTRAGRKAKLETNAARNARLNKAFDLPGFDFNPIFKKTRGK